MREGTAAKPKARRRRIIERPRLTRLLDQSQGRIKMLVAPAGYGKTTLARQWLEGKQAVWYTATPASADVAALAAGLCDSARHVVFGAGEALDAQLPLIVEGEDSSVLGGMLASDLQSWPREAWLIIDDYHYLAAAPGETFIETLLLQAPLNVLVMTRLRPSWASSRRVLYGEVYEVDRTALAMTDAEARALLSGHPRETPELIGLARGWPAVLALASIAAAPAPDASTATHLHRFFADEIYQRLDRDVQRTLCELALHDARGRRLVMRNLNGTTSRKVLEVGLESGFLSDAHEGELTMHPLLQQFLRGKLEDEGGRLLLRMVRRSARLLIRNCVWDEAYDLISRYGYSDLLTELLSSCMDDMLSSGRVASLRSWVEGADQESPAVGLVGAELAFREGRFHESESLGTLAAAADNCDAQLRTRALLTAGRAAHAASRAERAAQLFATARSSAPIPALLRAAMLGELSAAIELERADAPELLATLGPTESLSPDERVTLVSRMINLETRFGLPISVEEGRAMWQLLGRVSDPVARSSFRNVFGYALAAMGSGDEALRLTAEQLDDASRHRLDFVIPYALTNRAIVMTLRREYVEAEAQLDEASERARSTSDETAHYIAWAARARLYNAQAAFGLVTSNPIPKINKVTNSLEAELVSCYALAFAAQGELERARNDALRALSHSIAVETAITAPCALSVVCTRAGDSLDALSHARRALAAATRSGMIESFVCAYRGCPELVLGLLVDEAAHEDLERVLASAGDVSIAPGMASSHGSILTLTRREKEVLGLVAQGLSNAQIGKRLFISPVTVKVHVRHIFEKLGVKSRAEATLRAAQLGRD